jgi:hypothetical protein
MDDSFSCFLAISKVCMLHYAKEFNTTTNLLLDKDTIEYTASHLIILQPQLPHAGVNHSFLRCSGRDNYRFFISLSSRYNTPESQVWFFEEGNNYGKPAGDRGGKNHDLRQEFSLENDCEEEG